MSVAEIANTARAMLRDFPKYFEVEEGPLNVLTIRLPHPMVSPSLLQVYAVDSTAQPATSTATSNWQLDERNGLLKITDEALLNQMILVAGYYYTWFSDTDLQMHAQQMADEILYARPDDDYEDLDGVYHEVTAMGAVVRALWSLMLEFSFDIDVSTPEGMFIPARQRFSQILQAMQYWENEYNTKASALNIGLNNIEIFRLRRVARLTNRYVPVYREREFDDPTPPDRLYPAIPYGVPPPQGQEDPLERPDLPTVEERMRESFDLGYGGWYSVGTRG